MSQVKLGDKNIPFIYQGNELLYPNPVKDGLVLWYDFKGMKNDSVNKDIASDLSGNGNDGTLQNFAYTNKSGYDDGLKFDNIDDEIVTQIDLGVSFTLSLTIEIDTDVETQFLTLFSRQGHYLRKNGNALHCSVFTDKQVTLGNNSFFSNLKQDNKNKASVTMMVNDVDNILTLYGNGEELSSVSTVTSIDAAILVKLGKWVSSNNLEGKILSAKAYNRALSDEEIKHNYKLEKERWGL